MTPERIKQLRNVVTGNGLAALTECLDEIEALQVERREYARCDDCGGSGTLGRARDGRQIACESCGGHEDAPGTGMRRTEAALDPAVRAVLEAAEAMEQAQIPPQLYREMSDVELLRYLHNLTPFMRAVSAAVRARRGGNAESFCACGRRRSECDGSRAGCSK